MKKTIQIISNLFALALFAATLFSCSNASGGYDSSSNKNSYSVVRFVANMQADFAAAPQEISSLVSRSAGTTSFLNDGASRSAMPSVEISDTESGAKYYIEAVCGTERKFNYGTTSTLELGLESGKTWNVTCGIGEIEPDSETPDDHTKGTVLTVYMSDNDPKVTIRDDNPIYVKNFALKPFISDDGRGTIDLMIGIRADTWYVKISCSAQGWKDANEGDETVLLDGSKTLLLHIGSIKSGIYDVVFKFYDGNGVLNYCTVQTVNVYDNMTTNEWRDDGSGAVVTEGGQTVFKVTDAVIDLFTQNTMYVGATGLGLAPDNQNSGTAYEPLATLQEAAYRIRKYGNGKDYTIFVGGTIQGCTTFDSDITRDQAKTITIMGYNDSGDKLKGYASKLGTTVDFKNVTVDSIFASGEFNPVLTVKTEVPVTIQNVSLVEGASRGGSGLNIEGAHCSVTIKDVTISDNKASLNGGGVLVVNGSFYMKGGKITNNSAFNSDSNPAGGGVCLRGGAYFEMAGGEISQNRACMGGGVGFGYVAGDTGSGEFLFKRGKISQNVADGATTGGAFGSGGGIMVMSGDDGHPSVTMTGGEISGNKVNLNASAVEVSSRSSFTMTGGVIKENGLVEGSSGGANFSAIYVQSNANYFYLGGSAYIPAGTDKKHCVHLNSYKNGSDPLQMAKIDLSSNLSRHSQSDPLVIQFNTSGDHAARRGSTVASASFDLTDAKEYIVPASDDWRIKLSSDKKSLVLDAPIWVAGEGAKQCAGTPSEDGPGTKSAPYKSIYYACAAMTDPSVDYTIYIDGKLTGLQETPYMDTPKAASITIQGANGDNTVDILDGESCGDHVLTLYAQADTTIKDLKITGANITDASDSDRGGGVYSATNKTVTLSSGTLVTGNQTKAGGGGVYKKLGKLVIEAGAEISGNKVVNGDDDPCGGGVHLSSANFEMTGGVIKGNQCLNSDNFTAGYGGGIYFEADGSGVSATISGGIVGEEIARPDISGYSNMAKYGGGIFVNNGVLNISGGLITRNSASDGGGGVYMNADELYMSGGVIGGTDSGSKENGNNAPRGGGIYCDGNANIYLWGKALIGRPDVTEAPTKWEQKMSNRASSGGGIYLKKGNLWLGYKANEETADFEEVADGVLGGIIGNYAASEGGGVVQQTNCNVYMADGQIAFNGTPAASGLGGGGIYATGNNLDISGGKVSGNSAKIGGAIFSAISSGALKLSSNAYIPCGSGDANEIYLYYSSPVVVLRLGSALAEHKKTGAEPIALRLRTAATPSQYYSHGSIVVASNPARVLTDDDYNCFKLVSAHSSDGLDLTLSSDNKSIWLDKPIFVKQGGHASPNGSKTKPYATIQAACGAMTSTSLDYTILVDGIDPSTGDPMPLLGAQTIPEGTLAASITIRGANGLYPAGDPKAGEPKDSLDGNGCNEPVLDALCSRPVILGNIKITGAKNGANGGGVFRKNGDLYIQEGTLITRNIANQGAGVFVGHCNLYMSGGQITSNESTSNGTYSGGICSTGNTSDNYGVFIYGKAVIGGVNKEHPACPTSTTTKDDVLNNGGNWCANQRGGGVGCFDANLYLGYKSASGSDGAPTSADVEEWTGGIYGNYVGGEGGGVYVRGKMYMNSGEIAYNYTKSNGGGVYNAGAFAMSGGTIANNNASGWGGAVYNYGDFTLTSNPCTAYIPYGINGSEGAGKNDVYLYSSDYTIKIDDGALLAMASPIATVHFGTYSRGRPVLSGSALDWWCDSFALTSSDWVIGGEGKLVSALPLTVTYDLNITDTKAAPAASAFSLVDALYETTAENPAVIDEVDLIVTNILKPSYDGFVGTDDKIFKFAGWDANNDGTADITIAPDATNFYYPDNFLSSLAATDHAITLKAVWTEDTSPSDDTLEAVYSNITYNSYYYSDHDEFRIYTAEQAKQVFSDLKGKYFAERNISTGIVTAGTEKTITLMSDIDLGSMAPSCEIFCGILDGNGHTLTASISKNNSGNGCGLFQANHGTVKNLTLAGTITASGSVHYVGGICGSNNGTIDNCTVTATVKATSYSSTDPDASVGGIAGKSFKPVTNCTFSGTLEGGGKRAVGGVVGYAISGSVTGNTVASSATIKYTGTDTTGASIGPIIGKGEASSNTVELGATIDGGDVLTPNSVGYEP